MSNFKGLIDTTLRDGSASPLLFDAGKYYFTLREKKQIIEALIKIGITIIEFFSPVVSGTEKENFLAIKKYIRTITSKKILLLAHCRCCEEDIEEAIKAGFNGLNLYLGVSKYAQQYSHGKSFPESIKLVTQIVQMTRRLHPDLYLRYSTEDAFRTPLTDIFQIYDCIFPYVDTLGMPDTTGIATPKLVRHRVRVLKERYPQTALECHFHNDRGYALINTITAIESGVEYADASIWGIAERSGIASITAVLLNLFFLNYVEIEKYRIELCYPLNVLLGSILKMQVPFTEPVSLTNRTHIAGVHQKAVLNHKQTYEAHNLERFGVSRDQLLLGPLSGWNFIYYYLKEVENFVLTKDQARLIADDFKKEIQKINKKSKPVKVLRGIVKRYSLAKINIPVKYRNARVENLS